MEVEVLRRLRNTTFPPYPFVTIALASVALHFVSMGYAALAAPLTIWLAAIALLLLWIIVAITLGKNNRKPF